MVYVTGDGPGLERVRRGKSFSYRTAGGATVKDAATLGRIRALAIPPAWTKVWICPSPRGHLQAHGRDARGRKQYRYHPRFREVREASKFSRLLAFARALPGIRRRTGQHLGKPGLSRETVLAAVVRLLERTLIRIGNDEYARENDSFGLTTLRSRHVQCRGAKVRFHFRGKSRQWHEVALVDRRLARIVAQCRKLPGTELFHYVEGEDVHRVRSTEVNAYLRALSGGGFTAKDFRTWAATVEAAHALRTVPPPETEREAKRQQKAAIALVAERLGNTPAVCRASYIHPVVLRTHSSGRLARLRGGREEAAVIRLLEAA